MRKKAIIRKAVEIINTEKIYSVSSCLSSGDYASVFSEQTKRTHSQYEICFILSAISNAKIAALNNYGGLISFVMDKGNPNAEHVRLGFDEIKRIGSQPDLPPFSFGMLTFEDDKEELALQAADVVAWGARKVAAKTHFRDEFKPIQDMIEDERAHQFIVAPREALVALEETFVRS